MNDVFQNKLASKLGKDGQVCVENFLKKSGYSILARNYNVRSGEIDLVAQRNEIVCFVEVKTRSKQYFPISMSVNFSKQSRIEKAAKHFILTEGLRDRAFRFDVATVCLAKPSDPEINYIENAFSSRQDHSYN